MQEEFLLARLLIFYHELIFMQNKSFKKRIIHYDYKLVKLARKLRNNSTFSEVLLWNVIKNKQLRGYKFSRKSQLINILWTFSVMI